MAVIRQNVNISLCSQNFAFYDKNNYTLLTQKELKRLNVRRKLLYKGLSMPIVSAEGLDFTRRIKLLSSTALTHAEADADRFRTLHIGILNMMPDAALFLTERQFALPIHYASGGLKVQPHFITIPGLDRSPEMQTYVNKEYETPAQVKEHGLDGLMTTGMNLPRGVNLKDAEFYPHLTDMFDWAGENVASTLMSCMSSHAYMLHAHGIERTPLNAKRWGVYDHRVTDQFHPLTHGMDSHFDIPHSRWNEITEAQFRQAGMHILVASEEAGVHMATSADGLRTVCWQGHPEYNTVSLLKEWTRDLGNAADARSRGENVDLPPFPEHYFSGRSLDLARAFHEKIQNGEYFDQQRKGAMPARLEAAMVDNIENRWSSSRRALFSNWLAAVLKSTHYDLKKQYDDRVDPNQVLPAPKQSDGDLDFNKLYLDM